MMAPEELLLAGCEITDPVLVPHGYKFWLDAVGKGSGGRFARGEYRRGERSLELHFRYALGLVSYHQADVSASHEALMRAVGAYGQNAYPGFSDESLDGFRHLRADLERYGEVFLGGSDEGVLALLWRARQLEVEHPWGLDGLP